MKFFFSTLSLMLFLVLVSLFTGFNLCSNFNLFHYIFFLMYVGAILVLMSYLFFSSCKISFNKLKQSLLISFIVFFTIFFFNYKFSSKKFSSEYESMIYKEKEMFLIIILCFYMMFVLFSMMKIDLFRFSSLRSLF